MNDALARSLQRIDATTGLVTKLGGERGGLDLKCGADIPVRAISWLWRGWLPLGKLTICAGDGGTGKTTLCLGIAAALTSRGVWPDGTQVEQCGNALIWSGEDTPEDTLIPRLKAMGADLQRVYFVNGVAEGGKSRGFNPATDIDLLRQAVSNIGGVSLMMVDPIVQAVAGDMHRANDVRSSLQALVDFGKAHDCAVVGITHFAKGSKDKSPSERVIGSQAFTALARMVWVAAKEENGDSRVLAKAKTNIATDHGGIAYAIEPAITSEGIETTRATWYGTIEGTARDILGRVEGPPSSKHSAQGEAEQFLWEYLADGPKPTRDVEKAAAEAGIMVRTLRRARQAIGIKSCKEGGHFGEGKSQWMLALPAEGDQDF